MPGELQSATNPACPSLARPRRCAAHGGGLGLQRTAAATTVPRGPARSSIAGRRRAWRRCSPSQLHICSAACHAATSSMHEHAHAGAAVRRCSSSVPGRQRPLALFPGGSSEFNCVPVAQAAAQAAAAAPLVLDVTLAWERQRRTRSRLLSCRRHGGGGGGGGAAAAAQTRGAAGTWPSRGWAHKVECCFWRRQRLLSVASPLLPPSAQRNVNGWGGASGIKVSTSTA